MHARVENAYQRRETASVKKSLGIGADLHSEGIWYYAMLILMGLAIEIIFIRYYAAARSRTQELKTSPPHVAWASRQARRPRKFLLSDPRSIERFFDPIWTPIPIESSCKDESNGPGPILSLNLDHQVGCPGW